MTCPMCAGKTQVVDSRRFMATLENGHTIQFTRRRRKCLECRYRANTFELWDKNLTTRRLIATLTPIKPKKPLKHCATSPAP